jgi:outer membrane protein assembly factor BamB
MADDQTDREASGENNANRNEPSEASPTPAAKNDRSRRRIRRLSPPAWVWFVVACSIGLIVFIRVSHVNGDHSVENVQTLIVGFLGCSVVALWFLFLSGYSLTCRLGSLAALIACTGLFFNTFQLVHVSGELIPTFRSRWTPPADAMLETPAGVASNSSIDLTTTTEKDFPHFLGSHRNGTITNVALDQDWSSHSPDQLWRQPIGAGWSGFVAVNGYAVTMEQRGKAQLVTCYEIASGELLWSHAEPNRHNTVLGGTGPRSTPTIYDGKVYATGPSGSVVCLEGATGEVVWQDNLLSRYNVPPGEDKRAIAWGRSNSPLVVGDLVVLAVGGPKDGSKVSLAAFDRLTGKSVWESGDRQVSYASPTLAMLGDQRMIVSVNENNVSGHELATGDILWQLDWPGHSNTDANVSQASLLNDGRILLSKAYGAGSALWQLATDSSGQIQATETWKNPGSLKTKFTNHIIHDEYAFGLSDGILECIALADGKRRWKKGRFGHGQILLVGDVLLVQAESGDVVMVDPAPDRFHQLAKFSAIDGKTWNNLCLYGDLLLVRNAEEAACYRLPLTRVDEAAE